MRLPSGDARAGVLSRQCAGGYPVLHRAQPPPEPGYVGFRQLPPAPGHQHIAKKLRGLRCEQDLRLARMQLQPAAFEEPGDARAPFGQHARIIMEKRKVIDIAQVRRAEDFGAEMIERVEIEIGEELARKVADRQVNHVHNKFMLIDPLSADPIIVAGSANFSKASTTSNDENMLIIRGNTRVADIYLGEFMRLFSHHAFRESLQWRRPDEKPKPLSTDNWWADYFGATSRSARRQFFARVS